MKCYVSLVSCISQHSVKRLFAVACCFLSIEARTLPAAENSGCLYTLTVLCVFGSVVLTLVKAFSEMTMPMELKMSSMYHENAFKHVGSCNFSKLSFGVILVTKPNDHKFRL